MRLILSNNTELNPIIVTGGSKYVQGANRDALTFVFGDSYSMDELDALFTEANCETITLIGDGEDQTENMHKGYVIRMELVKKLVVTQDATTDTAEVTEPRIQVTMAQRTYQETKISEIAEEVTNNQLALCELYESMTV